jgi:integrase
MRTRVMDTHALIGEKLHVYRRENSPFWQCATYLAGRNHRISTKESDLERAKALAAEWYLNLQVKSRAGELKGGPTFRDAAAKFEAEYVILTAGERSPEYVKGHSEKLKVHLLPFLGDKLVTEISPQVVQDYRVHRMTSRKRKRKDGVEEIMRPARSTLHQEIITLRHVLKTAQRLGWLKFIPDLSPPYKASGKISHRAWFSPEEYKQLYNATRERAANPPKPRWKWECEQLHDFVLFMVNTGLRPDEAGRLQFRDVEVVKDAATKETILEISARGKRGVGYCKSMPGAVVPFERLRTRKRLAARKRKTSWGGESSTSLQELGLPKLTDPLFPDLRAHHLNAVLDEQGLKEDREGLRRSAYSLRHTYICLRLMEGADIYQIAKNCRTSVEMIEKFYASHIKNMIDASAVNVRREKANASPSRRKANAKRPKSALSGGYPKRRG